MIGGGIIANGIISVGGDDKYIQFFPSPLKDYNFLFNGERDLISGEILPAANYEGGHQSLDENGNLVNYTKDQYVLKNGYPVTCGAWKELCLRSTNPLLWTKLNALNIVASPADNIGSFQNAGVITDNGNSGDRYYFWQSATSGAPTGKQYISLYCASGTSGQIHIRFFDSTASLGSSYAGDIASATVSSNAAGTITIVKNIAYLGGRLIVLIMDWLNKSNILTVGVGPNSTTGKSIIVLGASVCGAIGTGDIIDERPFTETSGSVITLSSLSADLVNGRGPRIDYADAPKLREALGFQETITGIRGSFVNGTTFVDNCPTLLRFANRGTLTLVDSAGKTAVAVIKGRGTGETLGAESITGIVNSPTDPYETLTINSNGKDITSAINSANNGLAYTNVFGVFGEIYKIVCDITLNSGTAPRLYTRRGVGGATNQLIINPLVDGTYYWTWSLAPGTANQDSGFVLYNISTNVDFSLVWSVKKQLTPSTSGLITENWTIESGFIFNEASYVAKVDLTEGNQGQIEWTGTPSGLPASDNQILACNTTQGLLVMKSDGSAQVNCQRYSATLASAFAANTESKLIIPYEPGEMRLIHEANETVTDFSGTFGPGTVFGIGPGTAHMTHKSVKIFKRPRTTLDGMTTVYSGTVTGMLISAVAGTAFLDNLPAEVVALADGNHLIEVTDTAGKKLVAVMAAVGTGETLGSNLIVNGDMELNSDWSAYSSPTINERSSEIAQAGSYSWKIAGQADSTARGIISAANISITGKSLYHIGGYMYRLDVASVHQIVRNDSTVLPFILAQSTLNEWTLRSTYNTALKSASDFKVRIQTISTLACYTDNVFLKQVLTPSTSGVILVSHLGSSVQSPMYANSTFAYNQATAYGVTVKKMEA